MLSDEEMRNMGFKKMYIKGVEEPVWSMDMSTIKLDYTKYNDIDLLNMFLKYYETIENYDECIVIRDRITEIKNGNTTTEISSQR